MGLLCFLFGLGVWGSSSTSFWRYGSSNTPSSNTTQSPMTSSSSSSKTSSFWRGRKEWCLVESFMVLGVRERESEGGGVGRKEKKSFGIGVLGNRIIAEEESDMVWFGLVSLPVFFLFLQLEGGTNILLCSVGHFCL